MELLKEMIKTKGERAAGNILKVDSFLNHQLDCQLLYRIGEEFHRLFKEQAITKILTIEVSGVAIATMAGLFFNVPVVFAKKSESLNLDEDIYSGKVYSYTKRKEYDVMVSKRYLDKEDRVLIIDDFLAEGNAMKGLINVVNQSGATIQGIGIVIEKGFQSGGSYLREQGYPLKSLAIIEEIHEQGISFRQG